MLVKTCSHPGCNKPHQARGYCATHYRALRYGTKDDRLGIIQPHTFGSSISQKGYALHGHVEVHRIRAEKALGKKLPSGAVVHHPDRDKDNPFAQLVICPDQEYHRLIERRGKALEAYGDPEGVRCRYCKEWGHPVKDNFYVSYGSTHHRSCRNMIEREGRS